MMLLGIYRLCVSNFLIKWCYEIGGARLSAAEYAKAV
jgi:hypothetical protein